MRATYMGIDPGKSGGIAFVTDGLGPEAYKMPETEHDIWHLIGIYKQAAHAVIENVHSMPGQGVSSTFTFGKSFGGLLMALTAAEIPYTVVSPGVWQKKMGCLSKGDKNVTKRRAQQLFPSTQITHATADALLLAEYARRVENGL